jgi:hypothetical protein
MGRLGTAEEVVDVIVFIASPRAYWITTAISRTRRSTAGRARLGHVWPFRRPHDLLSHLDGAPFLRAGHIQPRHNPADARKRSEHQLPGLPHQSPFFFRAGHCAPLHLTVAAAGSLLKVTEHLVEVSKRTSPHRQLPRSAVIPPRPWPGRRTLIGPRLIADHVVGVIDRLVSRWAAGTDAGRYGGDRPIDLGVAEKRQRVALAAGINRLSFFVQGTVRRFT